MKKSINDVHLLFALLSVHEKSLDLIDGSKSY